MSEEKAVGSFETEARLKIAHIKAQMEPETYIFGQKGCTARIVLAMTEAYALAIAREMDRGHEPKTIATAFEAALANQLCGIAQTLMQAQNARQLREATDYFRERIRVEVKNRVERFGTGRLRQERMPMVRGTA